MTSSFEDSVLDFDINLFQQSSNNVVGQINKDKARKAIILSKRKMMSTDSLIRKYYDKRLSYRALEKCLFSSKEEYKQACIESMEYREKCSVLEDEIKKLQTTNKELEEKCIAAHNRHDGMQSHAKQLQQLVKENETTIESLKIEHQLEKANSKECEKNYTTLQKENEHLLKNIRFIRDVVFGKKKLTKELRYFLLKCGKSGVDNVCESEEVSCDETETFDDPMSPLSDTEVPSSPASNKNKIEIKLQNDDVNEDNTQTRDDNDPDSECSNEVVSLDTGRGSSLAFSDSDKCFNSPEYFSHHSPIDADAMRTKDKVSVDVATSPITIREFTHVATSPVIFKNPETESEINERSPPCLDENKKTNSCNPIITIDRVLSPIFETHCVEMSTSPVKNVTNDIATSPLKFDSLSDCNNHGVDRNSKEKECLELNNSNYLVDETSNDCEIQMILDTMRFNKKLITPLPTTPGRSRNVEASTNNAIQTKLHGSGCPDAAKIREENVALQATVAKLANDILNINTFLKRLNPLNNDEYIDNRRTPIIINEECAMEAKKSIPLHNQQFDELVLATSNSESGNMTGVKEDALKFDGKICKSKKMEHILFDDSSPLRSSDALLPLRASRHASPHSLSPHTSSPHASSPHASSPHASRHASPHASRHASPHASRHASPHASRHASPHASPPHASRHASPYASPPHASRHTSPPPASPHPDIEHSDNDSEDNNNLKLKDRLHFEDPLSNQGSVSDDALSDNDMYDREIVIELAPDALESDTNSLHEILKEQKSKQLHDEKRFCQKTLKLKKLTKLGKLRQRMLPKSKIKQVDIPTKRKRRLQPKRLTLSKERILKSGSLIDTKAAYEKACKVMSELKSKEKVDNSADVVLARLSLNPEKVAQKTVNCSDHAVKKLVNSDNSIDNRHSHEKPSCQKQNQGIAQGDLTPLDTVPQELTNSAAVEDICPDNIKIVDRHLVTSTVLSEPFKKPSVLENSDLTLPVRTRSQRKSISQTRKPCEENNNKETARFESGPPKPLKMYGRNQSRGIGEQEVISNNTVINSLSKPNVSTVNEEADGDVLQSECRKRLKRQSSDTPEVAPKRMLRSSSVLREAAELEPETVLAEKEEIFSESKKIVNYGDLNIFEDSPVIENKKHVQNKQSTNCDASRRAEHPKLGILCTFLDKYGRKSSNTSGSKLPENAINTLYKKIEDGIAEIQKLPTKDTKPAMDLLVQNLQGWKPKLLLSALIKYLKEPARKIELFNKANIPPAPPMTKAEQILIYIISQLKLSWPDIVENILKNIEYTLFVLNRTPEFDIIETLSHFYAVLCRYDKNRNRLRLFIIDAMYCLQYKAVPLIRQCLDVWMHILPLAHMGIAKNPLVTCLVYLLHFYKCEDKFNRVQEIRNILHRKYFYDVSEWNETRILEMFRNSIVELRDIEVEKKMLRMALIILAKRHGAKWCQNNVIKNMLQPVIEQAGVPDRIKLFCVSLLGPLLKPYPMDMKVNCEIVMNQLFDMLDRNPSSQMEEAIFTSLLYMCRHNQNRVMKALLFWKPESVSPEMEELLKNYVREKPLHAWKNALSKISINKI